MIDLVVNGQVLGSSVTGGGTTVTIDMATGAAGEVAGPSCTSRFVDLPEGTKDIELWLPHNEMTELISLRTNASVQSTPPSGGRDGCTTAVQSVTGPMPPVRRRFGRRSPHGWGGADLTNLGFGGSALFDQFTARAIRDTPAELISLKIGINLVNRCRRARNDPTSDRETRNARRCERRRLSNL
ncbi:hypothetical protein [Arthrobacter sp. 92]|uniref:hypothetical protein n=1 Tax=Arthrobacter sp. 92 TaxID=3418175 RepID=UPI003CFE2A09